MKSKLMVVALAMVAVSTHVQALFYVTKIINNSDRDIPIQNKNNDTGLRVVKDASGKEVSEGDRGFSIPAGQTFTTEDFRLPWMDGDIESQESSTFGHPLLGKYRSLAIWRNTENYLTVDCPINCRALGERDGKAVMVIAGVMTEQNQLESNKLHLIINPDSSVSLEDAP